EALDRLEVTQKRPVPEAGGVQLAGLLQERARRDELSVLLDRRRRPVRFEDLALQSVELSSDGAQGRRSPGGNLRNSSAEGHEVPRGLRWADVEEPVPGRGGAPVFKARLVEAADLEERGLTQGAHPRRPHVVQIRRAERSEVLVKNLADPFPFG